MSRELKGWGICIGAAFLDYVIRGDALGWRSAIAFVVVFSAGNWLGRSGFWRDTK
jgi:hypothetical protein